MQMTAMIHTPTGLSAAIWDDMGNVKYVPSKDWKVTAGFSVW